MAVPVPTLSGDLLGPLTGLEMIGTRSRAPFSWSGSRLDVNLASFMLEQVVTKRHEMFSEMVESLKAEMLQFLVGDSVKWLCTIPEQDANKVREFWRKLTSRGGS